MSICEAIEGEIRRLVFFQGLNGGRLTVAVDDPDDRLWPLSVDRDRQKTAKSSHSRGFKKAGKILLLRGNPLQPKGNDPGIGA